jgi:hypothetical protein
MAKATINLKSGAVVTIEGSSSEVAALLERLQGGAVSGGGAGKDREGSETDAASGPTALVLRLRDEGFFDRPRSLGDIGQAVQEMGYLYPVTTLSGVALGLLKRGRLHRKKEAGKWVYGR